MDNEKYNKEEHDIEFYKKAYEQEKAKSASLAGRLADAKNEAAALKVNNDIFSKLEEIAKKSEVSVSDFVQKLVCSAVNQ